MRVFVVAKELHPTEYIKSSSNLPLRTIRKGGSYEKGTMLRQKPEADIVLDFKKEKRRDWEKLMDTLAKNIKHAFPKAKVKKGENVAINIKFKYKKETIEFDVVASYHVNSPSQMSAVKNPIIYQGISTIWHVEYIKAKKSIPFFTESVMLLKDWKNKHEIPLKSFYLELIVASAVKWRVKEKISIQSIIQGSFREIQGMMDGTMIIPVDWKHFGEEGIAEDHSTPCIIDPANPNSNLLKDITSKDIQYIKSCAGRSIALLKDENFKALFDPKNSSGFFTHSKKKKYNQKVL